MGSLQAYEEKKKKNKEETERLYDKYSRLKLIQLKKKTFKIIEANNYEIAVENEEEVMDMDMGEVGGPMMTTITTSKEEKVQQ